jgi:hypothetical protein
MTALQVPIPADFWSWLFANKAWNDFPVVFLIVACFALFGFAARWFWLDYKREAARADAARSAEAEKDRLWREAQNEKREAAQDIREQKWRDILTSQYVTLEKISTSMLGLSNDLKEHDEQAKEIKVVVERIDRQITQPTPRGKATKAVN